MTVPENMTSLEMAQRWVLVGALLVLACLLFFCLIRAVKGPRVADRIVAVNMMGTMVMVIIAVMTLLLHEGYLADICLIYAMISFLAVIVLSKVYMGVYLQRKQQERYAAEDKFTDGGGESVRGEMDGKLATLSGMEEGSDKKASVKAAILSGGMEYISGEKEASGAGISVKTENKAAAPEYCDEGQICPASEYSSGKKKENITVNSQGGSANA